MARTNPPGSFGAARRFSRSQSDLDDRLRPPSPVSLDTANARWEVRLERFGSPPSDPSANGNAAFTSHHGVVGGSE
jgi:hypothetical protein